MYIQVCVLGLLILPLFVKCLFDFRPVQKVRYF